MATPSKKEIDRHKGRAVFARIAPSVHAKLEAEAKAERRSISFMVALIIEQRYSGSASQASAVPPVGR